MTAAELSAEMWAWTVPAPGPIDGEPLAFGRRPVPRPEAGEVLIQVVACGVCRTDLHLAEGDLAPRHPGVIPGHEIVGRVVGSGTGAARFRLGDRVGVAWLHRTCGRCRWCRQGEENLCLEPLFTGWDVDGGYAEWVVADEAYVYRLPEDFDDEHAAPLLCAGIIGYRSLKRAELPPGGRLGIYGFGASAHLTAQLAIAQGATVHVFTRSTAAQELARRLGVASALPADGQSPEPLDAAIIFAPVGDLVPVAMEALDRHGTLALAGIYLSDVPPLSYQRHLFHERQIRSVTANTRADGEEFLALASRLHLQVATRAYPLKAADRALDDLAHDRITGAGVLLV